MEFPRMIYRGDEQAIVLSPEEHLGRLADGFTEEVPVINTPEPVPEKTVEERLAALELAATLVEERLTRLESPRNSKGRKDGE